jgi:hypothetical protein
MGPSFLWTVAVPVDPDKEFHIKALVCQSFRFRPNPNIRGERIRDHYCNSTATAQIDLYSFAEGSLIKP